MTTSLVSFSLSQWTGFLAWVVAILLILWALRKVKIVQKPFLWAGLKPQRLIPLADATGIAIISINLAQTLFGTDSNLQLIFPLVIFVFILWSLRNPLMDMFSGIILRFEHGFTTDDRIEITEGSGVIKKVGLRSLGISLDKGRQISIPYSQFSTISLVKPFSEQLVKTGTFELTTHKSADISEIKTKLKNEILTLPWSVITRIPLIEPLEEASDRVKFKITVHALEAAHLAEIECVLRQQHEAS